MTTDGRPTSMQIQAAILHAFTHDSSPHIRLSAYDALAARISEEFPDLRAPSETQIIEALWTMLGQGLLYLNYYRSVERPDQWVFLLTEHGRAVATDELINPDSPDGYLRRLRNDVPAASEIVIDYAAESLRAYQCCCYLASAVMLGVATEAAFQELGQAFASWLPEESRAKLLGTLNNHRISYWKKFEAFRDNLTSKKDKLPPHLTDALAVTLDATLGYVPRLL